MACWSTTTRLSLSTSTPSELARLTDPIKGTVVSCEGDLAAHLVSLGWTEQDSEKQDEATSEKPKPATRRTRKPRTAE
jgi:hypothetical protein